MPVRCCTQLLLFCASRVSVLAHVYTFYVHVFEETIIILQVPSFVQVITGYLAPPRQCFQCAYTL